MDRPDADPAPGVDARWQRDSLGACENRADEPKLEHRDRREYPDVHCSRGAHGLLILVAFAFQVVLVNR